MQKSSIAIVLALFLAGSVACAGARAADGSFAYSLGFSQASACTEYVQVKGEPVCAKGIEAAGNGITDKFAAVITAIIPTITWGAGN